jgi:hypothetical protein
MPRGLSLDENANNGVRCAALVVALSLLEITIEGGEAGELEHGVIRLFLQLGAPVPRGREPPVDTAPRIEEVVCATAASPPSGEW